MKNSKAIDYQITKKQFDGILSTPLSVCNGYHQ